MEIRQLRELQFLKKEDRAEVLETILGGRETEE
jgi:hypothetical protein